MFDNSTMISAIFSVTELTRHLKNLIDDSFDTILVKGEVSNFKAHGSGHWYFTLKDVNSQISVVLWRSGTLRQSFMPKDGQEIVIEGRLTLYEKGGRYQLDANQLFLSSQKGDLFAKFEKLKEKLKTEGLFDEDRKKKLPQLPERIALLTSASGAAIRDISNVILRRYPILELFLFPVPVQGESAAKKIAEAIDYLNDFRSLDLILISRGGGSIEDLWPFNEEEVARAISRSTIPIVTGIGHETDFTIADFVADYRAPTPSAAAEIVTPHLDSLREFINSAGERQRQSLSDLIRRKKEKISFLRERLDHLGPANLLLQKTQYVDYLNEKILAQIKKIVQIKRERLWGRENLLQSLSPNAILKRGYTLIRSQSDIISSIYKLSVGDEVTVQFHDGLADATIKGVKNERDS